MAIMESAIASEKVSEASLRMKKKASLMMDNGMLLMQNAALLQEKSAELMEMGSLLLKTKASLLIEKAASHLMDKASLHMDEASALIHQAESGCEMKVNTLADSLVNLKIGAESEVEPEALGPLRSIRNLLSQPGLESEEEKDLPKFGVLVDKEEELLVHSMELLAAFENPNALALIEVNLKARLVSERVSFQLRRKSPCLPTPKHVYRMQLDFKLDSEEEDLPKFGTLADKEERLPVHSMEVTIS
ncbi:hypothetical protein M0R45_037721 [Rubus argutus]|uniref:Uncharacterized protein n=1 Tax=Rubus argutus TaxID=59490 RepID=A0AAW1W0V9_RUBAR